MLGLGDIHIERGSLPDALASYRDTLASADRLAKADPGNTGWQHDLSVSYDRLGDVRVAQGNLADALTSYQASPFATGWPMPTPPTPHGSATWRSRMHRLGDVQVAQGNLAAALTSYRSSLAIRDRLAKADPGNAGWQRDLSVSHEKLGDVQVAQGNLAGALASYQHSLAIADRLAKADPGKRLATRPVGLV